MPRPQRCRRVCREPVFLSFLPEGATDTDAVVLSVDEFEVIRLVDLEKRTHEQCAEQMDISRTTVTEIYEIARQKIADCLVNGRRLVIAGGKYRICGGREPAHCHENCRWTGENRNSDILSVAKIAKGENTMRLAITYENGQVFQHFGHTEKFKVYDIEDNKIVRQTIVDTEGSGHSALAGVLKNLGVDALICGGIGGGARRALDEAGIKLYGGVSGEADAAAGAFINGALNYNDNAGCDHHDHHHGEGGCGDHHGEHHCHHHMHGPDGAEHCHHHEHPHRHEHGAHEEPRDPKSGD